MTQERGLWLAAGRHGGKRHDMADNERRGADKLVEQVKEAVDRLAEAFERLIQGERPAPALVPVRRPTAEEIRRARQRQRSRY